MKDPRPPVSVSSPPSEHFGRGVGPRRPHRHWSRCGASCQTGPETSSGCRTHRARASSGWTHGQSNQRGLAQPQALLGHVSSRSSGLLTAKDGCRSSPTRHRDWLWDRSCTEEFRTGRVAPQFSEAHCNGAQITDWKMDHRPCFRPPSSCSREVSKGVDNGLAQLPVLPSFSRGAQRHPDK